MKFYVKKKLLEFDLSDLDDREKAQQYFLYRKQEVVPFLNSLLIIYTQIKDMNLESIEQLKDFKREDSTAAATLDALTNGKDVLSSLAFSSFNPINNFTNIYMNWEKIEAEHNENPEIISFIMLHELLHSYFGHFTKKAVQEYRKRNGALADKILDAQVNTFLINALGYRNSKDRYIQKTLAYLEESQPTMNKLFKWGAENYQIENDIDFDDSLPSLASTFKKFDAAFDDGAEVSLLDLGGSIGDHGLSNIETNNIAENLNKSVEELDKMNRDSFDYLEDVMKSEGINQSKALKRQMEAETTTKSVLEIVKLKQILNGISKAKVMRTYKRVHRKRSYFDNIPMKGKAYYGQNHIVIGIDVSGSVSEQELAMIKGHIIAFAKRHKKQVKIDLFFWSSCEIKPSRDLIRDITLKGIKEMKPYSAGGTDFRTVTKFLTEEYAKEKIFFVNITDSYYSKVTDFPTEIVEKHFGILTEEGQEGNYKNLHRTDNLELVTTMRATRTYR